MKYRHILLFLSFVLFGLTPLLAQQDQKRNFDIEKFKQQKAEFIKSEVGLTESESKAFTPLMNELMDKKFELNRSVRRDARQIRDKKDKSDADYDRLIDANLDLRSKELQLDKEYYQKFRKIISSEKIYKYQKAETKFMRQMVGENKGKNRSAKK